jgi:hypothetical protein
MHKAGGGIEYIKTATGYVEKPYALYECHEHHLVKVFQGFHGLEFSTWKEAPSQLGLGCLYCNAMAGAIEEDEEYETNTLHTSSIEKKT